MFPLPSGLGLSRRGGSTRQEGSPWGEDGLAAGRGEAMMKSSREACNYVWEGPLGRAHHPGEQTLRKAEIPVMKNSPGRPNISEHRRAELLDGWLTERGT